jgi:ferritin
MSEEEREHANKFMEYQNKRGGTIVLLDIKVIVHVAVSLHSCQMPLLETYTTKLGLTIGSA